MPAANPWLVRAKLNPEAKLRLFCLPHAGGGASVFRDWWRFLPSSVEVCAVQLPGREARFREAPFSRLSPLVEALATNLQPYLDRPYALFGHSMGALVGFELARHWRRNGPLPAHLFVSARRAPQLAMTEKPSYALPDEDFLASLRRFGGAVDPILDNPELLEVVMPALRADFAVVETYAYADEPRLDVPITAFGGQADPVVLPEHLEAWRMQTTAAFRLRMMPGDHFFLQTQQDLLLRDLAEELTL
jgi:medium-chain acyl-[acyl-carrier-protein] hydrolase